MRRNTRIGLIVLLTLLSLLGAGVWQATHPALDLLIVPGAQDLTIAQQLGQQTIRYTSTNPGWRTALDQRLRERRWRGRPPSSPYEPENYYRRQQIWFISMTEMIAVRGTSTQAEITIHRRIQLFGISIP